MKRAKRVLVLLGVVVVLGLVGSLLGGCDDGVQAATTSRPTAPPPDEYEPGHDDDRADDWEAQNPLWRASDGEADLECTGEGYNWPWTFSVELPPGGALADELNQILYEHDGREPLTMLTVLFTAANDEAGQPMEYMSEFLIRTPDGRIRFDSQTTAQEALYRVGLLPSDAKKATDLQKRALKLKETLDGKRYVYAVTTLPITEIQSVVVDDWEVQECEGAA